MQLASKQRYISAQLLALFGEPGTPVDDGLWLRNARHANAMAARLRDGILAIEADVLAAVPAELDSAEASSGECPDVPGIAHATGGTYEATHSPAIRITRPVDANAVFVTLPRDLAEVLRRRTAFYEWKGGETADRAEVRWMCSWATTESDVDEFLADIRSALAE
jgi:threonine aldolase